MKPKTRYLDENEIKEYWNNLGDSVSSEMIRLYVLTAMRKSELYKAKVEGDFIVIPNTKNGSDHYIPVNDYIRPYLYLLEKDLPKDIRKTLGSQITLHDLRRSTASLMAHLEIDSIMISRCLNHSLSGVTEKHYIQRKKDDTAKAFEAVGEYLTK